MEITRLSRVVQITSSDLIGPYRTSSDYSPHRTSTDLIGAYSGGATGRGGGNVLIFISRGFLWRILRRRQCLWRPCEISASIHSPPTLFRPFSPPAPPFLPLFPSLSCLSPPVFSPSSFPCPCPWSEIQLGGLRRAVSSPAGPGEARPPDAFDAFLGWNLRHFCHWHNDKFVFLIYILLFQKMT